MAIFMFSSCFAVVLLVFLPKNMPVARHVLHLFFVYFYFVHVVHNRYKMNTSLVQVLFDHDMDL